MAAFGILAITLADSPPAKAQASESSSVREASNQETAADSKKSRWAERPFAIELNLAPLGSPVGMAGLTLEYSVL
jgi:hypothetical protein